MTDEQKALASTYDLALNSVTNASYEVIDNPTAKFNGGGLFLSNAVVVRFKVTLTDLEGVVVKVTVDGTTYEIPSSEFANNNNSNPEFSELKENQYYVFCSALTARQMRENIYAVIYKDGVAISNTLLYSIESYAYSKQNDAKLGALIKAMMYYGDSAKALLG